MKWSRMRLAAFLGVTLLLVSHAIAQVCVAPPTGLVGWWPGDGDASDIQGSNAGTLQGTVSFPSAQVAQSFNFDTDDDRVVIPHAANLDVQLSGFTADFWMKGTKVQPDPLYATVVEKSHGFIGLTGWVFQATKADGRITFGIGGDSSFPVITSTVAVLDGLFHHIAGTWDGSTMRLYVDGVSQGTNTLSTPANNTREVNSGHSGGQRPSRCRYHHRPGKYLHTHPGRSQRGQRRHW